MGLLWDPYIAPMINIPYCFFWDTGVGEWPNTMSTASSWNFVGMASQGKICARLLSEVIPEIAVV